MDSGGDFSLPFDSFKSKKVLCFSFNKQRSADEAVEAPDLSLEDPSPEKPVHQSRRSLTHRQVREAAKHLRKLDLKSSVTPDPSASSATPSEALITKPNTSKTLPERYEVLDRFFISLQASIGLLGVQRSPSTFTNVSSMIEKTTNMRFGYSHLGQLKFIFPEGIKIEKVYVIDDQTSRLKPELLLTLNFGIIPNVEKLKNLPKIKNLQMNKLFRSGLVSWYESNREGDEVPEETLPEPFSSLAGVMTSSNAMENPNLGTVRSFDLGKQGGIISSIDEDSMMSRSSARKYTPKENKMPPLKRASYTDDDDDDDVSDMLSEICLAPNEENKQKKCPLILQVKWKKPKKSWGKSMNNWSDCC